ncbi:hypothetical protein KCP75_00600 [Salmonella enterica subsp. enterica]|nr:hypothetical protein KCP75_00600 [Salmonella enterica subsp. enterica]
MSIPLKDHHALDYAEIAAKRWSAAVLAAARGSGRLSPSAPPPGTLAGKRGAGVKRFDRPFFGDTQIFIYQVINTILI